VDITSERDLRRKALYRAQGGISEASATREQAMADFKKQWSID
jgi:hypothetical protein